MKRIAVAGAGGFTVGHPVKHFEKEGHHARSVDIKPPNEWYQVSEDADNLVLDLKWKENCCKAANGHNEVFNLAAYMCGMGLTEKNKAASTGLMTGMKEEGRKHQPQ